ncbi:MAG: hypothetical protein NPMRTHETA2_590006 [Nitrosopumilales archaeon]|nr:MAG: hypothetical protein NPMRTHETA2_590006 [Nitrosopumilales archaeon]
MEAEPECMCLSDHGGDQKMKKRVTISLDEKLIWMLRNKQTEMMLDTNRQISISAVVNNLLFKVLKVDEMISGKLDSVFVDRN